MKKALALIFAFIIVAAVLGLAAYGLGALLHDSTLHSPQTAAIVGISGGLGGVVRPIVAALFSQPRAGKKD